MIGGIGRVLSQSDVCRLDANGNLLREADFSGIVAMPDGEIHLALRGPLPSLSPAHLEASSDLIVWRRITRYSWDLLGRVFRDAEARTEPQRFYRVVAGP